MRVAIPVWQLRISPVFDTARNLVILEVEDGRELSRTACPITGLGPSQQIKRLEELDVDTLICGAVSRRLADMLRTSGIEVIPWISGDVEDVVPCYLKGETLGPFLMPGCARRNRGGCRRGRGARTNYPEDST